MADLISFPTVFQSELIAKKSATASSGEPLYSFRVDPKSIILPISDRKLGFEKRKYLDIKSVMEFRSFRFF